jgi:hypothetical protein
MNTSDRRSDVCNTTEEYHASVAAAAWVQQLNLHVNALWSHQFRQHSSSESSLHVPTDLIIFSPETDDAGLAEGGRRRGGKRKAAGECTAEGAPEV